MTSSFSRKGTVFGVICSITLLSFTATVSSAVSADRYHAVAVNSEAEVNSGAVEKSGAAMNRSVAANGAEPVNSFESAQKPKGKVTWETGDGMSLPGKAAVVSWIDPDVHPWAAVLCVHGLGFHKESFAKFGKRIARLGVATYSIDVRGFGSYKEERKNAKVDYDLTFRDIKEALTVIRTNDPEVPVFILGESMGGAISLQAAAKYPELVDGVISSVPSFSTLRNIPAAIEVAAVAITHGPNGEISLKNTVVDKATKDPSVQEKVLDNPATKRHLTVRDMLAYRKMMLNNRKCVRNLATTPVLLVQGFKDKLVGPHATTRMFNQIATLDKDLILIGNAEHLVFEEGQFSDATVDVIISWLNKHSYGGAPFALLPSQLSLQSSPVQTFVGSQPATPGIAAASPVNSETSNMYQQLGIARGYYAKNDFENYRKHYLLAMQGKTEAATTINGAGTKSVSGVNSVNDANSTAGNLKLPPLPAPVSSKWTKYSDSQTPATAELKKKLGTIDKLTVVIFFAPWTTTREDQANLEQAVQKLGKNVNCIKLNIIDPEVSTVAEQYGVDSVPSALIFDRNLRTLGYVNGSSSVITDEKKIKAATLSNVH